LKRPEVVAQHTARKTIVQKCAGGFTECGSANDRQQLFKNTKANQKKESCMAVSSDLKIEATAQFEACKTRGLLNLALWKMNALIDCVASNNKINDKSCKSIETVQDGYISTGEMSRTADGKGYNSCPDLYAMVQCTKKRTVLDDSYSWICSKIVSSF
jgi:hypothetical protein